MITTGTKITREVIESLGFIFKETNSIRYWYNITNYNRLPCDSSYCYWEVTLTHDPGINWIKIEADTSAGDIDVFFEGKMEDFEDLKKLLTYNLNIL